MGKNGPRTLARKSTPFITLRDSASLVSRQVCGAGRMSSTSGLRTQVALSDIALLAAPAARASDLPPTKGRYRCIIDKGIYRQVLSAAPLPYLLHHPLSGRMGADRTRPMRLSPR